MDNLPYGAEYSEMPDGYQQKVSLFTAVSLFFQRYVDFSGRSSRSEYWWIVLFNFIVSEVLSVISVMGGLTVGSPHAPFAILSLIWTAVIIIPSIALVIRRLHDIGKSGWYYFIALIPIVGWILILVWMCTDSDQYPNKWGPVPNWVAY